MNKLNKGNPIKLAEAAGSIDSYLTKMRHCFMEQFPNEEMSMQYHYITESFDSYVIVYDSELGLDQYYKVNYTESNGEFTFDDKDKWEVVELTYKPANVKTTKTQESTVKTSHYEIVESKDKKQSPRIKVHALTARKVTINKTFYPVSVLEAAVRELQDSNKLNESVGQGKIKPLLGEVEHPRDKGTLPSLNAAAFKWESAGMDGDKLIFEGVILPTEPGNLIKTLISEGVEFGFSIRGNGEVIESEDVNVVRELHLSGLDAVLTPSDISTGILSLQESQNKKGKTNMNPQLDLLLTAIKEFPEFFGGLTLKDAASFDEAVATDRIKLVRGTLNIAESADFIEALTNERENRNTLKTQRESGAISEAVKTAITVAKKYGSDGQEQFKEVLNGQEFTSLAEANQFIDAQHKLFSKLTASNRVGGNSVINKIKITPVVEAELGIPEYAKTSFDLAESIRARNDQQGQRRFKQPFNLKGSNLNRNQKFAADYLKAFDQKNQARLVQESAMFNEATQVSDLSLPTTVNRALIQLAVPTLIASSLFDVAVAERSPDTLYFNKAMTAETGLIVNVAAESFAVPGTPLTAVALAHGRIKKGSVVITGKTEDTDFFIDYEQGNLYLAAGYTTPTSIAYDYYAIREGEMSEIQRMKQTLSSVTISVKYDRLATQISHEAVAFSRSQMGLDIVSLQLSNLAFELAKIIDFGVMQKGFLNAKLLGAGALGGTYSLATNTPLNFAKAIQAASIIVQKQYYSADFILMGLSNAGHLSTWDALTAAGARSGVGSDLNGYVTEVWGIPVFTSTEIDDGAGSRILIGDRQAVQYRVFEPMALVNGGFSRGSGSNGKLIDAEEWFMREGNAVECVIPQKLANVKVSA